MPKALVTFTLWRMRKEDRAPVTINPTEVVSVEDHCGDIDPGQLITLKNKATHLVFGTHADVVAKLNGSEQ